MSNHLSNKLYDKLTGNLIGECVDVAYADEKGYFVALVRDDETGDFVEVKVVTTTSIDPGDLG